MNDPLVSLIKLECFAEIKYRGKVNRSEAECIQTTVLRLPPGWPATDYWEIIPLHAAETGFDRVTGQPRLSGIPGGVNRHDGILTALGKFRKQASLNDDDGESEEKAGFCPKSTAVSTGPLGRWLYVRVFIRQYVPLSGRRDILTAECPIRVLAILSTLEHTSTGIV